MSNFKTHTITYFVSWFVHPKLSFYYDRFFLRAWFLAIFRHFWAFLSHFLIFFRAFIHQKLFSIQGLYVFKKIRQQKKTDGEKWAYNNFANMLAQEWALSPGVCHILISNHPCELQFHPEPSVSPPNQKRVTVMIYTGILSVGCVIVNYSRAKLITMH